MQPKGLFRNAGLRYKRGNYLVHTIKVVAAELGRYDLFFFIKCQIQDEFFLPPYDVYPDGIPSLVFLKG